MKKLLSLLLFILLQHQLSGQCPLVFRYMDKQPAILGGDYSFSMGNSNMNNSYYSTQRIVYTTQVKFLNSFTLHSAIYHIWDGSEWTALKETRFNTSSGYAMMNIVLWGNRIIGHGYFKSIDSLEAPAGKHFAFIEYKNDHWDTLPGGTFDDTLANLYSMNTVATEKDLYFSNQYPNFILNRKGFVYHYNEQLQKFEKTIDLEATGSSYFPLKGGKTDCLFLAFSRLMAFQQGVLHMLRTTVSRWLLIRLYPMPMNIVLIFPLTGYMA